VNTTRKYWLTGGGLLSLYILCSGQERRGIAGTMSVTIHSILEDFRQAATSNRDLGDTFEKLVATYLTVEPLYQGRFSDVWLWTEWPGRGNQPNTGIDLVAKERYTGEYIRHKSAFRHSKAGWTLAEAVTDEARLGLHATPP